MKEYPLSIVNGGEDTYHLFSFGHQDFEKFMSECSKLYPHWSMGNPYHSYGVKAPRKGYKYFLYPCDSTHPKAIPLTCTDEAYGEQKYKSPTPEGEKENKTKMPKEAK